MTSASATGRVSRGAGAGRTPRSVTRPSLPHHAARRIGRMPYFRPISRLRRPRVRRPGHLRRRPGETLGSPYVEVYERRAGENGELVLRGDGRHFEIISNGVFLMDTRAGESERLLVRAALERGARPAGVLIGGP